MRNGRGQLADRSVVWSVRRQQSQLAKERGLNNVNYTIFNKFLLYTSLPSAQASYCTNSLCIIYGLYHSHAPSQHEL